MYIQAARRDTIKSQHDHARSASLQPLLTLLFAWPRQNTSYSFDLTLGSPLARNFTCVPRAASLPVLFTLKSTETVAVDLPRWLTVAVASHSSPAGSSLK